MLKVPNKILFGLSIFNSSKEHLLTLIRKYGEYWHKEFVEWFKR